MSSRDTDIARLADTAAEAATHSHSPYSRFPVGAAVVTDAGVVYSGCNVENASIGLTQCAERTALTAAIAGGVVPGSMSIMVIHTPDDVVHAPCGACRQVMLELMARDSVVVSACAGGSSRRWTLAELLPEPFTPESLLSSPGYEHRS